MITSVLISYNHEKTIETALLSLIQQKLQPSQIVILDNGSHDNTLKVVKDTLKSVNYSKDQIEIINLPRPESLSKLKSIAFNSSKNSITSLLFGNNFYSPDKLGESIKRLESEYTFCVYSDFSVLNKNFNLERIYYPSFDIRYVMNGFNPHLDNVYNTKIANSITWTENELNDYKLICQKFILKHCPLALHTIRY